MTAEVEEKKDLIQILLEAMGVPEGILEHGPVVILPLVLMVIIFLWFKEYYKENKEDFLKGVYLKQCERKAIEHYPISEQPQQQINNRYTNNVDQFQRGKFRDNYRNSLNFLLSFFSRLVGDGPRFVENDRRIQLSSRDGTLNSYLNIKSYYFCLTVALLYPIAFSFFFWVIGSTGDIGGLQLWGDYSTFTRLLLFFCFIGLAICFFFFERRKKNRLLFVVVGYLILALVSALSVKDWAYLGFDALWNLPGILMIGTILSNVFYKNFKIMVFVIMGSGILVLPVCLYFFGFNSNLMFYPLFIVILPIVNSLLDWLSLAFTRAFLFKLYESADSFWKTLVLVVIDIFLAVIFMLVLIAVSVAGIALVNVLNVGVNGEVAFNLTAIFKSLHSGENWQDNLWIHAMMLSTLVPTFLHFIFALIGLLMPLLSPLTKDELIELKQSKPKKLNDKIFWATVYRKPIVILASLVIVVGICSPIYYHGDFAFDFLLNYAVNIAEFFHPEGIDRSVIFPAS